jgi:hypothetical protein
MLAQDYQLDDKFNEVGSEIGIYQQAISIVNGLHVLTDMAAIQPPRCLTVDDLY